MSRPSRRAWADPNRGGNTLALALLALIALFVVVAAYLLWRAGDDPKAVNAETLCPVEEAPPEVTVLLLDLSDVLSEPQRLRLTTELRRIHQEIPRLGLLELYAVGNSSDEVVRPVLSLCNPGDGSDMNKLYQNPGIARRRWTEFQRKIDQELARLMAESGQKISPIMEAIQATALRSFASSRDASGRRRLVIVSDLLQNVPGQLSHYGGIPSFSEFAKTAYFSRVRGDLSGVETFVYYLVRPNTPQNWPDHRLFWEQYLIEQGASLERIEPVYGDR